MRQVLPIAALAAAALLLAIPVGGADAPPGSRDRCPVCGMFVAPYPEWTAGAQAPGGSPIFFDGAKDLFRFLAKKGDEAGLSPWVTDYYRVGRIDARTAWFVTGSDVLGPMGNELVPCATEAEAREFLRDHKGKRILRFGEVTPALLESLK